MNKTFPQPFLAALLLVALSQPAQAQYGVGYGYHPHQVALLRALALQAATYNQHYVTRSSCQPTRHGYYGGYRQPYYNNSRADGRVENEPARARAFYAKRRIRQQYLDEQRQRRLFTEADVVALGEHRDALREVMQIKSELAADRARRQAAGLAGLQEVNRVSGKIHWPTLLQDSRFASARTRLDTLFAQRAGYERVVLDNSSEIPRLTRAMTDDLKLMIREIPSSEYLAAKTFLKHLEVESPIAPAEALAHTYEKIR